MDQILHYFPELSELQKHQLQNLQGLYEEWNNKINVISRKDIDNLYTRHVLHSLAIAQFIKFKPGSKVLDLGTGGGFPGIPLAILFPKVQFTLIDGTGKKIRVVEAIKNDLALKNVIPIQVRAEELKGKRFDFVVTRAVAKLNKLLPWSRRLLKRNSQHGMPNGLIALKGGKVDEEIAQLSSDEYVEVHPVSTFFAQDFFEGKKLIYVQG